MTHFLHSATLPNIILKPNIYLDRCCQSFNKNVHNSTICSNVYVCVIQCLFVFVSIKQIWMWERVFMSLFVLSSFESVSHSLWNHLSKRSNICSYNTHTHTHTHALRQAACDFTLPPFSNALCINTRTLRDIYELLFPLLLNPESKLNWTSLTLPCLSCALPCCFHGNPVI